MRLTGWAFLTNALLLKVPISPKIILFSTLYNSIIPRDHHLREHISVPTWVRENLFINQAAIFRNQCHWFAHDTWCVHFRQHQLEQNGDMSVNGISYFRRFNRKVPNWKQQVKREIEEQDSFGRACGSRKETSNGIKDGPSHNCSHL